MHIRTMNEENEVMNFKNIKMGYRRGFRDKKRKREE